MRLGVPTSTTNDGQTSISNRDDQIVLENGVLDGSGDFTTAFSIGAHLLIT